jgi:hypothetical protein
MLIRGEKILIRENAKTIKGVTIIEAANDAPKSPINMLGSIFTHLFNTLVISDEYANNPKVAPEDKTKLYEFSNDLSANIINIQVKHST